MKLLLRVEYEFDADPDGFTLERENGDLYEPSTPAELCQLIHGLIKEDPRGVQDVIEDVTTRRVTLVVSPT